VNRPGFILAPALPHDLCKPGQTLGIKNLHIQNTFVSYRISIYTDGRRRTAVKHIDHFGTLKDKALPRSITASTLSPTPLRHAQGRLLLSLEISVADAP